MGSRKQMVLAAVVVGLALGGGVLTGMSRAAPRGVRPPATDCVGNLKGCLLTPLGRPGSGRAPGHSICNDCLEICRGESKKWPDRTHDGKDCQWWNR